MDSKKKQNQQPRLVIIEGNEKGRVLTLTPGTQILGRAKSDIVINDPRISRSHLSITFNVETEEIAFSDLNSLNGIQINGESKPSGAMRDGDQIQLGDTRLELQILSVAPEITAQRNLAVLLRKDASKSENFEPTLTVSTVTPEKKRAPNRVVLRQKPLTRRLAPVFGLILIGLLWGAYSLIFKTSASRELAKVSDFVKQNKIGEAVAEAKRLSASKPNDGALQWELGNQFYQQGNFEVALLAFQRAHRIPGVSESIHAKLLRMYAQTGSKEGISSELAHVDRIVREGPYDMGIITEIASTFLELRETIDHALEKSFILSKALQSDIAPNDAVGFRLEAEVLILQKKFAQSIEPLKRAVLLTKSDEWPIAQLAAVYLKLGKTSLATETTVDWINRYPNSSKAREILKLIQSNPPRENASKNE